MLDVLCKRFGLFTRRRTRVVPHVTLEFNSTVVSDFVFLISQRRIVLCFAVQNIFCEANGWKMGGVINSMALKSAGNPRKDG